tara:strand:- start:7527 stop:10664 length:3138 start_codon:yes stop_codon:yes gene_type:complete
MRIIHIADVHWRGLSRHDEYRESFSAFIKQARDLQPDIIYIGGDIVHSKTQGISPELIDCLSWWFTELSKICHVHVILGNHDGLLNNRGRQDAISPILSALDNQKIHLYKESGVYPTGVTGFNWCVFSCFDEEGWDRVIPIEGEINIALYHGGVWGSKTDIDWEIEGEVDLEFFLNYDFALLGDIHKTQFLNDKKTVAYCGSSIQQNYGEDPGKGFLFWDIRSKDDFDVTFYEIPHHKPFVTIDWLGSVDLTLASTGSIADGSRFRIRSDRKIHQTDITTLYRRLKDSKRATEIVFKIDQDVDPGTIDAGSESFSKKNLRDFSVHQKLMRTYYENTEISPETWSKIEEKISKYIGNISKKDSITRNTRWSIRKLSFDNTFGYGKGNSLNFDKLGGITGIFGKNRQGKSSIIGSLMYCLYNTTDRGGIKNIHIINTRKKHCKASVEIDVNGVKYRIDRGTVKHQARKGHVYATTNLAISKIDESGSVIEDMSGEQRRDTEKVVQSLIGTSDDFLLTSLSSQGEMNAFIKEKATSRKNILNKFLDLEIFDQMFAMAKDDSAEIRLRAKSLPKIDWEDEIKNQEREIFEKREKISKAEAFLNKLRSQHQNLKIQLATSPDRDVVTTTDVSNQRDLISSVLGSLKSAKNLLKDLSSEVSDSELKINKINTVRSQFPLEDIKEKLLELRQNKTDLLKLEHELDRQKTVLKNQERSIKKLEGVPCGDQFPSCRFIKDSHRNKLKIEDQKELISLISSQAKSARRRIKTLESENLEEKINRYDDLINKESELKVNISSVRIKIHETNSEILSLEKKLDSARDDLSNMEIHVVDDVDDSVAIKLKKKISDISSKIVQADARRLSLVEQIGKCEMRLANLVEERDLSVRIFNELEVYDLIMQGVSKRGIPRLIMRSQLPYINSEISKILQGVMGFTVELEADTDSNSMDVFINYGDSKRVIELGSGMEKMISSLAIRVALINVSSLPKPDVFIIDEGFGTLDENNVASCNLLLDSMRKWFKNILIISHVDGVKDVVDNVLDISSNGKNAELKYN